MASNRGTLVNHRGLQIVLTQIVMTRIRWFRRVLWFGLSLVLCLGLGLPIAQGQSVPADPGWTAYQAGRILEAIAQWEQALPQAPTPQVQMRLHRNLGQAYRQVGRPAQAIRHWDAALQLAQQTGTPSAPVLIELAQTYADLGQHQEAVTRSQQALQLAEQQGDRPTAAAAHGSLGTAYWALGDLEPALAAHQRGLAIACDLANPALLATSLNNVGNLFVSYADRWRYQATAADQEGESALATQLNQAAQRGQQVAIAAFQRSVIWSERSGAAPTTALLNLNRLRQAEPSLPPPGDLPQLTCPQPNLTALTQGAFLQRPLASASAAPAPLPVPPPALLRQLAAAPDSQDKAFGYINLALQTLPRLSRATAPLPSPAQVRQATALLQSARTVAQAIQDRRAESFALGLLGQVDELTRQYPAAIARTQQAQFLAQAVNAADSLYRWQWQSGRILVSMGDTRAAIAAYEQAIGTLQTLRTDLIIANRELQFDFRDAIEPVYRELIGLLLASDEGDGGSASAQTKALPKAGQGTERALEILELLKLAELQDYFRDDCVQVAQAEATAASPTLEPHTAVIYTILLGDRSYELLRLPTGELRIYPLQVQVQGQVRPLSRAELGDRVDRLRALLEKRSTEEYLPAAQQMYDLLIRPLEPALQAAQLQSLVFVQDGALRKVPMAALHDGQQFLIQKYPIATTPSLSLTNRRPLDRRDLRALAVGLTLEQPPFAALPNVQAEIQDVHQLLGGTQLLDQEFTVQQLQERLQRQPYRIVHMATHGQFGGNPENTFLLTYRDRIPFNTLDQVLQTRQAAEPVELLTLSACQTAAGDERSALGIAGLAVRAGVKSAIATLWFINDEATVPLVEEFYTQLLKPGTTKAQALQQAQVKMIDSLPYSHPAIWSAFILVGNWL